MPVNGQIPADVLTKLTTPGYLMSPAAKSFERLKRDAATTGTDHPAEAYRSLAEQERLFFQNYQPTFVEYAPGKFDRRVYKTKAYYRKPGFAAAAIPGTSNHGLGSTVDWQNLGGYDSTAWKAFAARASRHGWNNIEGKEVDEPWHWTYVESNDQYKETGMELTDLMTLSSWANAQLPGDSDKMTVNAALGYMAGGAYTAAEKSKLLVARLDTVIANQKLSLANEAKSLAKMDELIAAVKNIAVTVVIPPIEIAGANFVGTITPKEG
jgi:hypothetical protein